MDHFQRSSKAHSGTLAPARLRRSFYFALSGLAQAWQSEANLRIEASVGVVALALAVVLQTNIVAVLLTTLLVLSCELFNSALEALIDMVMPEYHPLAKRAKDIAAGAVLLVSLGAVVIGVLVFVPPLWHLFTG